MSCGGIVRDGAVYRESPQAIAYDGIREKRNLSAASIAHQIGMTASENYLCNWLKKG